MSTETVGEKIKSMRKLLGVSQEKLAEMLMVSRQAVTKWETGAGLPDVENIRAIANLFGVSIDYLINSNTVELTPTLTVRLDPEKYGQKLKAYPEILKDFYGADWEIYPLERQKKLNAMEKVFNFAIGWGTLEVANQLSDMSPYFLAKKDGIWLLLNIKNWTLTATRIPSVSSGKKFTVGNECFHIISDAPIKLFD